MKKEHKEIIAGSVAALIIIVLIGFVSFEKLGTFNFVKAGIGFAQIQFTDTDYVEIQKSPRIVLVKDGDSSRQEFMAMLESEGYDYDYEAQMGSSHTFKKGSETQHVISHHNGYFTRWTWNE